MALRDEVDGPSFEALSQRLRAQLERGLEIGKDVEPPYIKPAPTPDNIGSLRNG